MSAVMTKIVHVVSWVYWSGDEQGGGGFNWFENSGDAERAFAMEKSGWGDTALRVRLVDVELPEEALSCDVPHACDYDSPITCWIDSNIDLVETELPARKVHISDGSAAA